ncbi:gas vesicle protein [Streptomyces bungoensis]|uniref:Gas vesicle protein n=1 Tax=Streptomyces bungoensis TaxID=285568 RepID=A0A101TBP5_9ACTN|nr:gas vesicle protein [Streptomyces bungoensis]
MTVTGTATTVDTLYVYGIAPAGVRPPDTPGVGGAPVRLLTAPELCAAVSGAPERVRARRRDLAAHQAVLDELLAQGPVLPMRFGVLSTDPAALRTQLRADRDDLTAQLDSVRDCLEMNVKGTAVPGHFADLVRRDEKLRVLARRTRQRPDYEANVRLGEALARGVRREARRAAGEVLARLTPLAVRVAGGPLDEERVLSASFLLRCGDEQRFREEVAALAGRLGDRLALSVTGPLPCYSFVAARPAGTGR